MAVRKCSDDVADTNYLKRKVVIAGLLHPYLGGTLRNPWSVIVRDDVSSFHLDPSKLVNAD